jgi:hypothetical protein
MGHGAGQFAAGVLQAGGCFAQLLLQDADGVGVEEGFFCFVGGAAQKGGDDFQHGGSPEIEGTEAKGWTGWE